MKFRRYHMDHAEEPQRDPLDELRESIDVAAKGTSLLMSRKRLKSYADAWESEREDYVATVCRLSDNLTACQEQNGRVSSVLRKVRTEYQAKLESMTKDRDEWRSTYENVSPDVMQKMSELQAKLDASMFVPLDADGVPCRIGDEMATNRGYKFVVCGYAINELDDERPLFLYGNHYTCLYNPLRCNHVTKSETIEDVRTFGTELDRRIAERCFDELKGVSVNEVIDRAYECGRRDGGDADISGHCPKSDGTASIGDGTCPDGGAE